MDSTYVLNKTSPGSPNGSPLLVVHRHSCALVETEHHWVITSNEAVEAISERAKACLECNPQPERSTM